MITEQQFSEDIIQDQEKTRKLVLEVLQDHEHARDSDRFLIEKVWERQGFRVTIPLYVSLPETIRRVRQAIQEKGDLLPTSPEVCYRRHIKENVLRQYYGNNPFKLQRFLDVYFGVK